MTEPGSSRNVPRSIGAVIAGVAVGVILSIGTDFALHAAGILPAIGQPMSDGLFGLAAFYRTVYGILGSYLTARLAPGKPMLHAMVLGFLGLAANILGAVATWNRGAALGHHWYPVTLIVLALPTAWLGAKLFLLRQAER